MIHRTGWIPIILAFVLVIFAPALAGAQDNPAVPNIPEPQFYDETAVQEAPVTIPPETDLELPANPKSNSFQEALKISQIDYMVPLIRKWSERQRILGVGELETADNLLPALVEIQIDLGIRNLFSFSNALIREGDNAWQAGQYDRALRIFKTASVLSPDMPVAHYHLAQKVFIRNAFAVGDYSTALIRGLKADWLIPQNLARHASNASWVFMIAIFAVITVVFLILLVKYNGLLTHLLQHIFIIKISNQMGKITTLLLLSIPLFIQWGMVWIFLIWGCLFLLVARPVEKILVSISLILLVLLPYGIPFLSTIFTAHSENPHLVLSAMKNESTQEEISRIEVLAQKEEDFEPYLFALGFLAKKRGHLDHSKTLYLNLLESNNFGGAVDNNLGNVFFAQGNPEKAIGYYKKQPNSFYKSFNLYRAYYEINDVQRGTDALAKAKNFNEGLFDYYESIKPTDLDVGQARFNRLLADQPLAMQNILPLFSKPSHFKVYIRDNYWRFFFAPIDQDRLPFCVIVIFVLIAGFSLIGRLVSFPKVCDKCAGPACQWCYATAKRTELCSQCFNVYVRREAVDPAAREAKDIEILELKTRQSRVARISSFLLPGAGHFSLGYIIRGIIFMFISFSLVTLFLFLNGPFPSTFPMQGNYIFRLVFLSFLSIGFYILVLRDIFQEI